DGRTERIPVGREYRAIAVGNLIVLCYTLAESPEKVFFRVINQGSPGPVTEIPAAGGRASRLRAESMLLGADSGRIRFMNTLMMNTLYELKLEDSKTP